MKNIIRILLLSVATSFQACIDNSTTFPEESGVFYGNLSVGDYTEYTGISITPNSDSTAVDVFFDDVKFAKLMPVRVDITVKNVPCVKSAEMLVFSALDIDPYMNTEKFPQRGYRFSEITGTVIGDELLLSARMADDLEGTPAGKRFSFRGERNDD